MSCSNPPSRARSIRSSYNDNDHTVQSRSSPLSFVRRVPSERRTFFLLERQDGVLLVLFLALLVHPLLYLFRGLDDNTLTSWRWVFSIAGPGPFFLVLVPAVLLALFLARRELGARQEPALLFFAGCAAVVPLWSLPEVIIDASRYFVQAKYAAQEGVIAFVRDWGGQLDAWTDLPLIPLLFGLLFRLFGEARMVAQCFTTLLFALAMLQTYFIGRRLWDRETGFLAGVMLLAMPYLPVQVPLLLVDVPTLFLVTSALLAYLEALERSGPLSLVIAGAAVAGALLAKYSAWPMLLLLPLATAVLVREGRSGALRRSAAVLGVAAVLAGPFLVLHRDVVLGQVALLRSYQWPALGRWSESAVSTFLFQVHPFVVLCAFVGALRAFRERDLRFVVPGWFVLFLVVLQVERARYLVPLFPLLALMAAYGLRGLFRDSVTNRFVALSAAAVSLALLFTVYQPYLERTTMVNLRDAGSYLDTLAGETVHVEVLPQQASAGNTEPAIALLDLFTRKRIVYDRKPLIRPDEKVIAASPLRFTWDHRPPVLYAGPAAGTPQHHVIISGQPPPLRDTHTVGTGRVFAADTGHFRYRTSVVVRD